MNKIEKAKAEMNNAVKATIDKAVKTLVDANTGSTELKDAAETVLEGLKSLVYKGHNPTGEPWDLVGVEGPDVYERLPYSDPPRPKPKVVPGANCTFNLSEEGLTEYFEQYYKNDKDIQWWTIKCTGDPEHVNKYSQPEVFEFMKNENYLRRHYYLAKSALVKVATYDLKHIHNRSNTGMAAVELLATAFADVVEVYQNNNVEDVSFFMKKFYDFQLYLKQGLSVV
jgi:hypothetical protein